MRRIFCIFLALVPLLTLSARAAEPSGEAGFDLGCSGAVLMERETGTVLYAKGEHQRLSPASVTLSGSPPKAEMLFCTH